MMRHELEKNDNMGLAVLPVVILVCVLRYLPETYLACPSHGGGCLLRIFPALWFPASHCPLLRSFCRKPLLVAAPTKLAHIYRHAVHRIPSWPPRHVFNRHDSFSPCSHSQLRVPPVRPHIDHHADCGLPVHPVVIPRPAGSKATDRITFPKPFSPSPRPRPGPGAFLRPRSRFPVAFQPVFFWKIYIFFLKKNACGTKYTAASYLLLP